MQTVVSANIGTTPSGLPRSRGSTCCSTEAKYELKSTRSERRVTRASIEVGRLHEDARDVFEDAGLGIAEAREHRAIQVQHADDAPTLHHGNDDLAVGGAVAGDVAGECVHVGDHDRSLLLRRGAAHTLADG